MGRLVWAPSGALVASGDLETRLELFGAMVWTMLALLARERSPRLADGSAILEHALSRHARELTIRILTIILR